MATATPKAAKPEPPAYTRETTLVVRPIPGDRRKGARLTFDSADRTVTIGVGAASIRVPIDGFAQVAAHLVREARVDAVWEATRTERIAAEQRAR